MKILNVRKIGFYGATGDDRSPESFAFPAALTSMMECLGEDYPVRTLHAHGRDYMQRTGNLDFVAASGIGFGLLWDAGYCMSAMDLLQASPYERGIANAMAWAGWEYDRVTGADMPGRVAQSIEEGRPVIVWGLTEVPEAALICGCNEDGSTVCGWSHFQDGMETIENGMFLKKDWARDTWEVLIPVRRAGRSMTVNDIVREGVRIMSQSQVEGYQAGDAAYDAWIKAISQCREADEKVFSYHHNILFNLAEARCWCGAFLKEHGVKSGEHFSAIHDLCWQADSAAPNAAALAEPGKRAALAEVLARIREEDRAALEEMKAKA